MKSKLKPSWEPPSLNETCPSCLRFVEMAALLSSTRGYVPVVECQCRTTTREIEWPFSVPDVSRDDWDDAGFIIKDVRIPSGHDGGW